jgi:hypothetical protein
MLTLPPAIGVGAAYLLWRSSQPILGNLLGALVIFGAALALIGREYVRLDRATQACLDAGTTCWPEPSAFTRFAIFACIALAEVCALFMVSVWVEGRIRNRRYAPEWRW